MSAIYKERFKIIKSLGEIFLQNIIYIRVTVNAVKFFLLISSKQRSLCFSYRGAFSVSGLFNLHLLPWDLGASTLGLSLRPFYSIGTYYTSKSSSRAFLFLCLGSVGETLIATTMKLKIIIFVLQVF